MASTKGASIVGPKRSSVSGSMGLAILVMACVALATPGLASTGQPRSTPRGPRAASTVGAISSAATSSASHTFYDPDPSLGWRGTMGANLEDLQPGGIHAITLKPGATVGDYTVDYRDLPWRAQDVRWQATVDCTTVVPAGTAVPFFYRLDSAGSWQALDNARDGQTSFLFSGGKRIRTLSILARLQSDAAGKTPELRQVELRFTTYAGSVSGGGSGNTTQTGGSGNGKGSGSGSSSGSGGGSGKGSGKSSGKGTATTAAASEASTPTESGIATSALIPLMGVVFEDGGGTGFGRLYEVPASGGGGGPTQQAVLAASAADANLGVVLLVSVLSFSFLAGLAQPATSEAYDQMAVFARDLTTRG